LRVSRAPTRPRTSRVLRSSYDPDWTPTRVGEEGRMGGKEVGIIMMPVGILMAMSMRMVMLMRMFMLMIMRMAMGMVILMTLSVPARSPVRSPLRIDVDDDEDAGDDGVMKGVEKGRGEKEEGGKKRKGMEEDEGKWNGTKYLPLMVAVRASRRCVWLQLSLSGMC
jgi:hypothetical protein